MDRFRKLVGDAGTVLHAAALGGQAASYFPTHRQCSIELRNGCCNYTLLNPSVHMESGHCSEPLPVVVEPSSTACALFLKTANTACGAVGVFTYDLCSRPAAACTHKLAVMFSVPYDFNLYSNWFSVGIFDKTKQCDHGLYNQMYNRTDRAFVRGKAGSGLTFKKDQFTVMATMTNTYGPVIRAEVKEG